MPVPEFNEIKAPAIQLFADGKPRKISEVFETLAKHFALSDDDLSQTLPSGTQSRWHNRANWACYDLYRAGLLDRPKKGLYVITELGKKIAKEKPVLIDRDYLLKFPSFVEFVSAKRKKNPIAINAESDFQQLAQAIAETPQETIETAYRTLQSALKAELLGLVSKMDPVSFEKLVLDLLIAMGYGGSRKEAAKTTKASHDEGIDGVINEDRLGLDVIYVQAKAKHGWPQRNSEFRWSSCGATGS